MMQLNRLKNVFLRSDGSFRTGWKLFAGIAAYWIVFYAVFAGSAAIFGVLFSGWGLTNDNLAYAPSWAQAIVRIHSDACYGLAYAGASGMCLLLTRGCGRRAERKMKPGLAFSMGSAVVLVLTTIALCVDSLRMEGYIRQPALSADVIPAVIVMMLGLFGAEILTKRIVFDALGSRLAAYVASSALYLLLAANLSSPAGIVSAILTGVVTCLVYENGGLAAAAAFQAGMGIWSKIVFAWPTAQGASLYKLYHVSDAWFTGGNEGMTCGWGYALLMLVVAVILLKKDVQKALLKRKRRENHD